MVDPEPDDTLSQGEIESSLISDQHQKNPPFSSLGRQNSVYSLTLDEFQNTLCGSGKNFWSMNMDEFLTSIWNAEENQAINSTVNNNNNNIISSVVENQTQLCLNDQAAISNKGIVALQPSLARQGSLSIPAPLCNKTVDEVWSEIHGGQQGQQQINTNSSDHDKKNNKVHHCETAPRQPTFGEMTLEDFLIKAGIVKDPNIIPAQPTQQQHFGMYQTIDKPVNISLSFPARPAIGMPNNNNAVVVGPAYQPVPSGHGVMVKPSSMYLVNDKRNSGYSAPPQQHQPPPPVCYSGGGYGPGQPMGVVPPAIPSSPEGICGVQQVDSTVNQFGMHMGGMRGKKRIIDGPVEKVVERRQRRMIKNRESAARSRARKLAYTVELETELDQLKEENAQLKQSLHSLAELERKRKQQYFEELKLKAYTKDQKAKEKLRIMRRNMSCPL